MEERCVLTEAGGQIKWRECEERKRDEKRREEKTEGREGMATSYQSPRAT